MRRILVPLGSGFLLLLSGLMWGQPFTASITAGGSTVVCYGKSVTAYIWFSGGREPYDVVINNSEGEFMKLENIVSPHTLFLKPEANDTFYIASAVDSLGRDGATNGEIIVIVRKSTPVTFDLDRTAFLSSEPGYALTSSPSGATFFGPGVASNRFYPAIATPVGSPHTITCTYTNTYGCESTDETDLFVLSGEAGVYLVSGEDTLTNICDESASYLLKAYNEDNFPGTFALKQTGTNRPVSGHIIDPDLTDDQATFDASGLTGGYDVIYTYGVNELKVPTILSIEINDLGVIGISGIPVKVCGSDDPYELVPEISIEDPSPVYIFSGPGVTGNQEEGFYFDPEDPGAVVGKNIIELDYTSTKGCTESAQKEVTNQFTPKVSFSMSPVCLSAEGGLVSFDNTTSGKFAVTSWSWNFGDPGSGVADSSALEHPTHFYSEPGFRKISLTAFTSYGCMSSLQMDTALADEPVADFLMLNDCFSRGEKTLFLDRSMSEFAEIDNLTWTFKTKKGGVLGEIESQSPSDTIAFPFTAVDQYLVTLRINSEAGCPGEVTRTIDLRPIRNLTYSGYYEDFNGPGIDWMSNSEDELNSWVLDEPDFTGFEPVAGDLAWHTGLPGHTEGYLEQSWVQSPCLNFSGLSMPLIQLDLMKSFVPGEDGVVLQYQELASEGWKTIGSLNEGLNWYNDGTIVNKPGGSSTGWGLAQFEPDSKWINAGHSLSMLAGKPFVTLRFAIGTGGKRLLGNQGFAFDNLFIGQRIRRSVLEYFTNSTSSEAAAADLVVKAYALEHPGIVYDLQYHMDYPGTDPMNENNPYPPSARSFNNGVPGVPYAILNGGAGSEYRYDFSEPSQEPDSETLVEASLEIPLFSMNLAVDYSVEGLDGIVKVTCTADTFTSNLQLYVVLIEREVTSYPGLNQEVPFRNVVLDMWPSPAGRLLGNEWGKGTSDSVAFSWDYPAYVENVEDLSVVAFVMDRDNRKVLQAVAIPHTPGVGIRANPHKAGVLVLYPNPAHDHLYINYGEPVEKPGQLLIVDLSGRVVMNSNVQPGYVIQTLDISKLSRGMYMIYRMELEEVKGYAKFVRTE